ncbi:Uncharacterised protein [Legionella lansingensis]|uniref:Uncharacterized protein n=1 Tax=Legionella lansingensis TaxID=45067 RepID=A0A0W0VF58_9GAMM|nr:hypothetical protein [Legionella lansingensis]KTD18730.1 hypothetical protein Llan_2333 [Legionella lansingensis]SNV58249.1 Uncharacterised protein [Legionella lansingensis]
MTFLSKEALEKIKQERAARNEEEPEDINALFRELDVKIQEKKQEDIEAEEEYNPFAEGDFKTFDPEKK